MSRPSYPIEEKKREGTLLGIAFEKHKAAREPEITQDQLVFEIGRKSQGLFSQWISGTTRIADRHLIWLGKRLRFNPIDIRPSLSEYLQDKNLTPKEAAILLAYREDPLFHRQVDAVAESSPFYLDPDLQPPHK
jgi:hypothetical protein